MKKCVIGKSINKAKKLLDADELVAIPTETVYGLAANAYHTEAVLKLFQVKNRPTFDPLIVHASDIDKIYDFTSAFPVNAQKLAEHFWPGPLTLLLPKKKNIPDLVTAGSKLVGVRIPHHQLTLSLLDKLDYPLAAPSANPFGYISPTEPLHVSTQLGNSISYILDGGHCTIGIESTIVGFDQNEILIYRLGGIPIEEIENRLQKKVILFTNDTKSPNAPGMLASHYAPRKKFTLGSIDRIIETYPTTKIGVLNFCSYKKNIPASNQLILSYRKDTIEAASNLFSFLRKLDESDVDIIIGELVPEEGLGRAINDRLRRAAHTT